LIEITSKPNSVIVFGRKRDKDGGRCYLHRGISQRKFECRFHLGDWAPLLDV
jgi:HSP20 family molecular chaperone IbpA